MRTKLTDILFIGVDAGDPDLIAEWAASGRLPTFRKLLDTAAWGFTENPPGLFVGAIWPSFYTGVSPARHTRYCYRQLRPGTYETYAFHPSQVAVEPFWQALSRAGKTVGVIDVPKTAVSSGLNGLQIVDWGTHDPDYALATWPAALAAEVSERFGRDTIGNCNADRREATDFIALRDALVGRVSTKMDLTRTLLARGGWDCFLTVFSESHCIGHQCWHLHDPTHPRHDAAVAEATGDPLLAVYAAIDAAVGTLLDDVGPQTLAIVLASHGMGPHYDATFLLDAILQRLEELPPPRTYPRLMRVLRRAARGLPDGVRRALAPLSARAKAQLVPRTPPLHTRKCFQIPNNDVYGAIRINLAGREPAGLIQPGPEHDAFCAWLTDELMRFVNVDTGAPLVRQVLRTRDLYPGNDVDHLPDLLVEWNRDAPISAVHSPTAGTVRGVFTKCRTGDHKPRGLFFATGATTRPGRVARPVSVVDFAPTIGAHVGVGLSGVEGTSFIPLIGG